MRRNYPLIFVLLALLTLLGVYLSLFYGGSTSVSFADAGSENFIFWDIRLPKTITAIAAGMMLAVSGLILQVLFRNPLAGPFVLGISSGAALMVALGMLGGQALDLSLNFFAGRSVVVLLAVSGSLAITFLILFIARRIESNVILLLIGLMFSQICGAVQSSIEFFAEPAALKNFVIWGMGSLSGTSTRDLWLIIPTALICLTALLVQVKPLNALLLGEQYAKNLGIDFKRSRFYLLLLSSVLTGITTAFCGPIAFIGTAVPILSRMIFASSRQEIHFAGCLLLGPCVLLFADAICNVLVSHLSLPINMITTLIGAPLVIYLMFKNQRW